MKLDDILRTAHENDASDVHLISGHPPMMPDYAMGFWQCKLRYRTQDELMAVARAASPKAALMALVSAMSPSGVEVPWALT